MLWLVFPADTLKDILKMSSIWEVKVKVFAYLHRYSLIIDKIGTNIIVLIATLKTPILEKY